MHFIRKCGIIKRDYCTLKSNRLSKYKRKDKGDCMSKKRKMQNDINGPIKPKKRHKKFWLGVKIALLVMLLTILAAIVILYMKFGNELLRWQQEGKATVDSSTVDTFKASETSIIYASNKSMLAKLKGDKDSYYLSFEKIPQYAKDAMVASEDREFYQHEGVNFMSTMKAAVLLVKSKLKHEDITRGGSTITQQLVKNVFLTNKQSYERKVREIFMALEMEKRYTKDQILEFYINNIYFNNGYYGIEAASRGYFSKSASELSLAETAFLCAIPNNPNLYNPLEHFDNTMKRKTRILKQMLEEGMITAAEYSDANYEEIVLDPAEAIKTQNYMTTYAISCATKALMHKRGFEFKYEFDTSKEEEEYKKEYDTVYNECYNSLYTGGYRIYTSLNKKKQRLLQSSINNKLSVFKEKNKKDKTYKLQGAATCIDNKTGFVVAIVGGRKQKSITGYTLNRAYQSYRQPGSCFKPLVVYTPQLERGYTPDTIVDDSYFEGGPKNSGGTYSGKIPLRNAVERSKNVVAWKLFEELTPQVGLKYVLNMNFAQIVDTDYVPAAALGGLTHGVTTVEMASAYSALENDGVYREPTCIVKITDADGKTILNNKKSRKSKHVYKKNAARTMTNILEGVLTKGTAAGHALNDMACAGKTGTTSDQKDGWFCGYTPYFTTVVWVGYDTPKTLYDLYGSKYPLSIWEDFMTQIHEGLEYEDFQPYDDEVVNPTEAPVVSPTPEATIDPDAKEPDVPDETAEPAEPDPTVEPDPTEPPDDIEPDDNDDTPSDQEPDVGDDDVPDDVGDNTDSVE